MMKKHFYSDLVDIEEIVVALDDLELDEKSKKDLVRLAHENLHASIVERILSELSETDKKKFLHHLYLEDHKKTWEHLNSKIDKLEDKIVSWSREIKTDLKKDI